MGRSASALLAIGCAAVAAFATLAPARAQDAADLVVRLNRIEGQLRTLSGQVEQLGYENRQLKDQLRKFQEDTEYRFQEKGGRGSPAPSGTPKPGRRSDAFDPAETPSAPGAPRQLGDSGTGAIAASPGRDEAPRTAGRRAPNDDGEDAAGARPFDLNAAARGETPPAGRSGGASASAGRPNPSEFGNVAGLNPSGAGGGGAGGGASTGEAGRADYDAAYASLSARQYERAEAGFRGFIGAHPRDRLVPDATYWLGESLLQRGRSREAAEQFLKVSTEHARSAKAPEAMLKLGVALAALGARDQACATFAQLERKYPSASTSVRQGVEREQKKGRCAG